MEWKQSTKYNILCTSIVNMVTPPIFFYEHQTFTTFSQRAEQIKIAHVERGSIFEITSNVERNYK